MYLIDRVKNRITEITKKSFTQLGFKERTNLQEWLAYNPSALGEDLLIIQKEFSGFDDTHERLDLLALDKNGNVVIIENKLDDTGRDVTWQALKYASYCSTLTSDQIAEIYQFHLDQYEPGVKARERFDLFFENGYDETSINVNQRIILVAAQFRKEVTSTVIWLSKFNIRVNCFKATPYEYNDLLFLKLDQILPVKEAEDYIIKMAGKNQEELIKKEDNGKRHQIRLEFWSVLLNKIKGHTDVFQNNSPTKDNMLYAGGTNITYVSYIFAITQSYCSAGLKMSRESKEENKLVFDLLHEQKDSIEKDLGFPLEWERANENVQSLVFVKMLGVNAFEKEDWPKMTDFLVEKMAALASVLKKYLPIVKKRLNESIHEPSVQE
jgi:hypothetical protein